MRPAVSLQEDSNLGYTETHLLFFDVYFISFKLSRPYVMAMFISRRSFSFCYARMCMIVDMEHIKDSVICKYIQSDVRCLS